MGPVKYYLLLAWRGLWATPCLSLLTLSGITIGFAVFLFATIALNAVSGNPFSNLSKNIYAVQLDGWDPNYDFWGSVGIPWQLTYQDAINLGRSTIPEFSAPMYQTGLKVYSTRNTVKPLLVSARATGRDFFELFDVSFKYGSAWSEMDDTNSTPVVVLSENQNQRFFQGENSVGKKILLNKIEFEITGVTDNWHPRPKIHDLTNGPYSYKDEIYIPFSLSVKLELASWGKSNKWQSNTSIETFDEKKSGESTWVQYWVAFRGDVELNEYKVFLENYISIQRARGRFLRPTAYKLSSPEEWMDLNEVVNKDTRLMVAAAYVLLFVCLLNTAMLQFGKINRNSRGIGVRQAVGATKLGVIVQSVVEASCLSLVGLVLSLVLTSIMLNVVSLLGQEVSLAQQNIWAYLELILVMFITAVISLGVMPVWRVLHETPASLMRKL